MFDVLKKALMTSSILAKMDWDKKISSLNVFIKYCYKMQFGNI